MVTTVSIVHPYDCVADWELLPLLSITGENPTTYQQPGRRSKLKIQNSFCWTCIIFASNVKSWLIGKDPDAGRDWGLEEKGTTEDEMAGWHHRLDEHEFEWWVGDREAWRAAIHGVAKSRTRLSDWLNWTELNGTIVSYGLSIFCYNILNRLRHWALC